MGCIFSKEKSQIFPTTNVPNGVVIVIELGTVHSGIAYSFEQHKDYIKFAFHGELEEHRVPTQCDSELEEHKVPTQCDSELEEHKVPTPCDSELEEHRVPTQCDSELEEHRVPTPCDSELEEHRVPTPCDSELEEHRVPTPCDSELEEHRVPTPCDNELEACTPIAYSSMSNENQVPAANGDELEEDGVPTAHGRKHEEDQLPTAHSNDTEEDWVPMVHDNMSAEDKVPTAVLHVSMHDQDQVPTVPGCIPEEILVPTAHGCLHEEGRVPTVILLNPDQTFHSFGYEAQQNYKDISDYDRKNFFYIENFKTVLYKDTNISRNTKLKDITGKPITAMKVFAMTIHQLKVLALNAVFQSKAESIDWDIQWIITIPAIASDSVKQFMREAASEAGIPEKQLRLVLEPEAAALYGQQQLTGYKHPTGLKYVVADLGGGILDICVHEILEEGKLREVYQATGDIIGAINIDYGFENFMTELVGGHVWSEFRSCYILDYMHFRVNFQTLKEEYSLKNKTVVLEMEKALVQVVEDRMQKTLDEIIKCSSYASQVEFQPIEGQLVIQSDVMQLFFKPLVDHIIHRLREIFEVCRDEDIKLLMLVGGFSHSLYVRESIEDEFSDMKVIFVEDARSAVMKGAVMMGWKPNDIAQRRSRFTYGFPIRKPFIEGQHPESLKLEYDGDIWCNWTFGKMIEKGQTLDYGQTFKWEGYCTARELDLKHREKRTVVFTSVQTNPRYCIKEEGCSMVGKIVMKPPPEGWPDEWDSDRHLIVRDTELTVKYFNTTNGQEYEALMDFL